MIKTKHTTGTLNQPENIVFKLLVLKLMCDKPFFIEEQVDADTGSCQNFYSGFI